ncbi:Holliday junction branch migration protein RuvA [Dictyobacter arantiisoli]|nr:Holliday junction branch migration protein RuvA [Dictyobacter arantiisoli]
MITSIHGTLEATGGDHAIIRVGGFGIRVFVPSSTLNHLSEIGMEVSLMTHFHMREDGISLYGFWSDLDRNAFEQLIGVNGVGPKVALAILSAMDAVTFYQAIANEDLQQLGLAKGVGKRLAAQLVLELKGKLPSLAGLSTESAAIPASTKAQAEALEALMGLGYSSSEAQAALSKIPAGQAQTLEDYITFALRSFSRQ